MDSEHWNEVISVFRRICESSDHERPGLLKAIRDQDPDLAEEAERMWREQDVSDSFLKRPPVTLLASLDALPSPGDEIAQYRILSMLGSGGMGVVYLGEDTRLKRKVALKFLAPHLVGYGRERDLFLREAQASAAVCHPNICTVFEINEARGRTFIAMAYIQGETLAQRIAAGPLPVQEAVELTVDAAAALQAAHASGLIHQDIKPANLMVSAGSDGRNHLTLMDFGLAESSERSQLSRGPWLAGTISYMAPERIKGSRVDRRADIWSLGAVLYEMLTGERPFRGGVDRAVFDAIEHRDADPPSRKRPGLPAELDAVVSKALAKDPDQRHSSAAELLVDLRGIAEKLAAAGLVPVDGRRSASEGVSRLATVSPRLLTALATLGVAAGLAGWLILHRASEPAVTELRIKPLTSQLGWEASPAVSPDGDAVAFTWTEQLDRARQIYVKHLSNETIAKLTDSDSPGMVGALAWSPDGKQIAYKRWYGHAGAIRTISSSGGEEKKLAELSTGDFSSSIDWSPDGTLLAYSDQPPKSHRLLIYLVNVTTGEKRKLTSPPASDWGDWDPKFSPDGRMLAFKRVTGFWLDDLYLVPSSGGAEKRFTSERRGIWGHAWTSDGNALIVSSQRAGTIFDLWRFPIAAPERPVRLTGGGVDAITPATGRRTRRIAWVNQTEDFNIYRIPATGRGVPVRFIASTLRDFGPKYAADGRIAFISDRSGTRQIWLASEDGLTQVQISTLNGATISALDWSPDGRQLIFSASQKNKPDLFMISCPQRSMTCGEQTQITTEKSSETAPAWSADGRFMYFTSDRGGRDEIWRQPVDGKVAVQVTHHGGYICRESPDGKWLYFSVWDGDKIWRIPGSQARTRDGSYVEELVIGLPYKVQPGGWTLTSNELFFVDRTAQMRSAVIRAYDLSTGTVRAIVELTDVFSDRSDIDLSVSPDGRWLLYTRLDRSGGNVMATDETGARSASFRTHSVLFSLVSFGGID